MLPSPIVIGCFHQAVLSRRVLVGKHDFALLCAGNFLHFKLQFIPNSPIAVFFTAICVDCRRFLLRSWNAGQKSVTVRSACNHICRDSVG